MKRQTGFTLVEFAVAMGVTTVALAATMLAFKDATTTNQMVGLRQDIADNMRAGLNLMEQDLIQAGSGIPTGGIAIPTTAATTTCAAGVSNLNRPLLTGSTKFPVCNVVIPSIEPGNGLGPLVASPDATTLVNTDVVTMLYQDNGLVLNQSPIFVAPLGTNAGCAGSISAAGSSATFDTSALCVPPSPSGSTINAGDLLMFSNANGNALALVTSVSWPTVFFANGDAFGLNQTGDPAGTLVKLQNPGLGTYPPTTVTRITMVSYYLDNITDPMHVRLIRRVNFNPAQPVGETVENLQFTYNYNDGVTVNQPSVPATYSESQIRSVNVYIGARSDTTLKQTGQYLRTNFQTQVSLRSMAYFNSYK